jgi:threonyl-tRNA synthetase
VLPISDKFSDYAHKVANLLNSEDIRAEVDDRSEKIGRKIRDTELMKVPYMLIVGEKEMNENMVAVRKHGEGDKGTLGLEEFVKEVKTLVKEQTSAKKAVVME